MCTKLLSALLVSAALIAPGVALADVPADRCPINMSPVPGAPNESPGDANKFLKGFLGGTPGQNVGNVPANEFAAERNAIRKEGCPPPGKS
jgi:hypothetical protein